MAYIAYLKKDTKRKATPTQNVTWFYGYYLVIKAINRTNYVGERKTKIHTSRFGVVDCYTEVL